MRRGISFLALCVSVLLLSGFAAGLVSSPEPDEAGPPVVVPHSTGSSPKVHLAEVLTGTWCPPCGTADPAISRLADEWGDNLIVIAWHCCQSTNSSSNYYDPWHDPAVLTPRNNYYQWAYLPTVVLDGGGTYGNNNPLFIIGAPSPTSAAYDRYLPALTSSVDTSSNIVISIDADLGATDVTATIQITATDPVLDSNLYLRTVLYEDALYYPQANGPPFHRNVARALNEQPLTITMGQTVTLTVNLPLGPTWKHNKLGIAAFVQSNTKRPITISGYTQTWWVADVLNAAKHDLVPRGILLHSDRGTLSDFTERDEVLLALNGEHFDTWNAYVPGVDTGATDDRTMPSAASLAESPLAIWHTGTTNSNVLSPAERTLLGNHQDGGGSLLLSGSNLGFDAWVNYRTWFQQYLHAQFNGDDTGLTTVTGVTGDPVSNAWAGTSLPILGSPDRIDTSAPAPNRGVPFVYPGAIPGSVRAEHDADSRVVYLGFQYFESSDTESRRANVLSDIISWMDSASAPKVSVVQPNGGEQLLPGQSYTIKWNAHDVRIPRDGVDIYFTSNYGPSTTWELVTASEPNDGVYRWTVPDRNSVSCRVKVVVRDGSASSPDGEAISAENFICGDPFFRINFGPGDLGWRLISFPVTMSDTTIQSVLSTIAGSYASVRAYDASTPADPWKAYVPTKAGNDLSRLDNTMAFWIQITGTTTLDLMGDRPTAPTPIMLYTGWNLVGFPSMRTDYTVAQLKTDTGATQVEGFDPGATPYFLRALPDSYVLTAGEGYWIYVPAPVVWIVPV